MRRTTTMLSAALLLAGLTVGCSADSEEPAVVKASGTPSTPSSATPSPTPSETEEVFHLGDTVDISTDGRRLSASVLAYKDTGISAERGLLQPGQKWAAAEVKVCNTGSESLSVGPFTWSLAYEDGARVEPMHMSGGEAPRPLYPLDARVKGGDCVRGNILFEVPKEGRAERVLYWPRGLDEQVEWLVTKD